MAKFKANETSSTYVLDTIKGSHRMEIKGYSLTKRMGVGEYITSDIFSVGGYKWAIRFYPYYKDSKDENSPTYVSVFIELRSTPHGTKVKALIKFTLVALCGSMKNKVFHESKNGPLTFDRKRPAWGCKHFYKKESLETSEYLHEDRLVLECTIGVVATRMERPKKYSINVPPSNIATSFRHFFDSKIGCDIVFKVEDKKFHAHKLIIAARSAVFKAQFYGHVGKTDMDIMVIEEITPPIFKAMLLYIYTDSLPDVHEIMGSKSSSSFAIMVQHLLAAANRFGIDRLKLLCESKLCDGITVQTVVKTLALAEQQGCAQLKSSCLEFIASNLNALDTTRSRSFRSIFTRMICGGMKSSLEKAGKKRFRVN